MMRNALKRNRLFGLSGIALVMLAAVCQAQTAGYTVTTLAGTGEGGFSGDGGQASSAQLFAPVGLVLDSSGNLYIADQLNNRVRKIAPGGIITTVAGKDTKGFSGDGGSAVSAELNHPCGLALDSSGNLYIADTGNHAIRKVTPAGTISTVAGNGSGGFSGDGEAATGAVLNTPMGLAIDAAGNLYFADSLNDRIRKIATGGTITTVAGSGTNGSAGDGGAATSASLNHPQGITLDSSGVLFIADTSNDRIRTVSTDGIISTVAGNGFAGFAGDGGAATQAQLNYPKSVAVDGEGNFFVVDSFNSRVRRVAANGMITTVAGNGTFGDRGDGGPATKAQFRFPSGVARDSAGNLYVADSQNSRLRLLTPAPGSTGAAPTIATNGVVSASEFGPSTAVAPGTWIEIYGTDLASAQREWSLADFNGPRAPTALGGTRVNIGGTEAFLAYVSPTHINALLPSNTGLGEQQVTVTTVAGTSTPHPVTVNWTQPGLYAPPVLKSGGKQYAGAFFDDGATLALPPGAIEGLASRRARPGETIVLYGVGFGPVNPTQDSGEIVEQQNVLAGRVEILFGGTPATVAYAGLVQGSLGLYQFNVVVPDVPDNDAMPLTYSVDGATSAQTLYTTVAK